MDKDKQQCKGREEVNKESIPVGGKSVKKRSSIMKRRIYIFQKIHYSSSGEEDKLKEVFKEIF